MNMGMACHFAHGTWLLLKEKSGLARRYGIQLLRGVVHENYWGPIKVILLNTGLKVVSIPHHVAFCQGILLPCSSACVVPRTIVVEGEWGATRGVNKVVSGKRK